MEELGEPLEGEVLRDDDEGALGDPELAEAREDEARLDRLAEPDLVREHEARHAVREDAACRPDLMRQHVHAGGEERAQGIRAAERLEADDARAERERRGRPRVARRDALERSSRPLLEGRVGRDLHQRRIPARYHRDPLAPREADREPSALVRHLDHDPDAPAALGPVDHLHAGLPGHLGPLASGPGPVQRR